MKAVTPLFASLLILSACGGGNNATESTADNLEQAADQSDPAAAEVLDNAADQIRDENVTDVNATAQAALQEAGNAQAGTNETSPQ